MMSIDPASMSPRKLLRARNITTHMMLFVKAILITGSWNSSLKLVSPIHTGDVKPL